MEATEAETSVDKYLQSLSYPKGVRIYLAGSWRWSKPILCIARQLRAAGLEVDAFCDQASGRVGWNIAEEFAKAGRDLQEVDPISALTDPLVGGVFKQAFAADKYWLGWSNCVVMCMPCGHSAHLEGGYGKGQGKKLFMYWMTPMPQGEFDNMYQFADGMFRCEEFSNLVDTLLELDKEKKSLTMERGPGC